MPAFQEKIAEMREQLFSELEDRNGLNMPIRPPVGEQYYDRKLPR